MAVSIFVKNLVSNVKSEDKALIPFLKNSLTFEGRKTPPFRFKMGNRSMPMKPKTKCFISPAGKFPTGLLPDVQKLLDYSKKEYTVIDERSPLKVKIPTVTSDFLQVWGGPELRDYQVDVTNTALAEKRGIIKCPTGGGKTMIISAIIKALEGKLSALLLMRSKLLVSQTYKALQGVGISDVGQLTGDKEDIRNITVATIQSMHKIPDKQLASIDALIVDEVHEFGSTKIEKQLMKLKSASFRLGFSATPWKDDDMIHNYRLKSNFGSELSDIAVLELQERGILSECVINFHEVMLKGLKDRNYQDAENEGIVQNFEFHMKVSQIIRQIPSGRIMIMVSKLQHGDYLHSLLPGSFWIRGSDDMDSREVVLEMLRSTKEKKVVVIMSKIGYIGINVHLHHLINATGGKSSLQLIQKLGRGLRTSDDKDYLSYHDFDFRGNKYLEEHSKHRKSILINQGYNISS